LPEAGYGPEAVQVVNQGGDTTELAAGTTLLAEILPKFGGDPVRVVPGEIGLRYVVPDIIPGPLAEIPFVLVDTAPQELNLRLCELDPEKASVLVFAHQRPHLAQAAPKAPSRENQGDPGRHYRASFYGRNQRFQLRKQDNP
jgi:hypothetical protein